MKMSIRVVLLIFILAPVLAACSGSTREDPTSTAAPSESVTSANRPDISTEQTASSDTAAYVESTSASDTGSTENAGINIYSCRINENGSEDFVFEYVDNELLKIKYKACIKGMPEEIEAADKIKNYTGVTMSYTGNPDDSMIVFEIDISNGGLTYLKDTHRLFKDVSDCSWDSIKAVMEANGYRCLEENNQLW